MSQAGRVALVVAVLALAAGPAAAKSISISITPQVELDGETLTAKVAVRNGGDEAAHSVSVALFFRDQQARGEIRPQLGPSQALDATLSLPVGEIEAGRWPFRVAVDYTDANQYPFQALHAGLLTIGNPAPAKVAVAEVKAGTLTTTGTLGIRVKNLAAVARTATVRVAAPEGIEVTSPPVEVTLAPWGEAQVRHELTNRTALAGSRYPLFVTVEYDEEDGLHQAVIGQGVVDIRERQSFFETWRIAFWVGAGLFVVAWLGYLLWRATAPRQRRAETRP
jgi:hypothetical protein